MNVERFKGDNLTVVGVNAMIELNEGDDTKVEDIENTRFNGILMSYRDDNDFDR